MRKIFFFAVEMDVIEVCPFLKMSAPSRENTCERFLSADEINNYWRNLETTDAAPEIQRALKLFLVTGQRPGEVIGMHCREIDERCWTILVERSKNREANRVYLTDTALKLIGEAEGYIFESPRNPGHPFDALVATKSIKWNLNAPVTDDNGNQLFTADGKPAVKNLLGVANFTPHDLRRTASTYMAEIGIPEVIIDKVQDHVTKRRQGLCPVSAPGDYAYYKKYKSCTEQ